MQGLRSSVILGTFWTVALRWIMRLIGIANVAILARILGPSDFGLVAMATLVIGLIETWLAFGVESALIQNAEADRHDYDTAWTIRLLQGVAITALVIAAAPLAQAYFKEPRLGPLLWALSLGVFASGLSNIGVVKFSKDLQFQKDFWFRFLSKLLGFSISVAAALWLRNYWALAVGIVGGYTASTVLSYVVHPYRPRFSVARWHKLWSFSQWLVLLNMVNYAESKADEVLVGGYTTAAQMGLYSVASDVGQMPTAEIAAPMNRVLFPAFAQLQGDPARLAAAYAKALAAVSTITIPAGIGLALVAPEAVRLLLGVKWASAAPLLSILAMWSALRSVSSSAGYLLMSIGRPKLVATIACVTLTLFCGGAAFALSGGYGAFGIAIAKLVAALVSVLLTLAYVVHYTEVRPRMMFRSIVRPVVAAVIMASIVIFIPDTSVGFVADLALKVAVGAIAYASALLLLWRLSGYPDGPEHLGIGLVRRLLLRTRSTATAIEVNDAPPIPVLIVIPWSPNLPAGVSVVVRNLARVWRQLCVPSLIVINDWASRRQKHDIEGVLRFRFALTGSTSFSGLIKLFILGPIALIRTYRLLNENSIGVVQFHYPGLNALGISLLKRFGLFRGRLLLCFHGSDVQPPATRIEALLWRIVLSTATDITACSKSLASRIAREFRIDRDRVTVVYNGVDTEMFCPDARANLLEGIELPAEFIVTVGSYIPRKGHRDLIEAISQVQDEFPDLRLVILGQDGADRLPLLEQARSLGLAGKIDFLVDLTPAEVSSIVARATACIQPSLVEPFGLAVIEAGSCGVPVAASRVGGHVELIDDGNTGLLFSPGNPASILAALRLLLNEPESAASMAANFRRQVSTRFTWENCAKMYLTVSNRSFN